MTYIEPKNKMHNKRDYNETEWCWQKLIYNKINVSVEGALSLPVQTWPSAQKDTEKDFRMKISKKITYGFTMYNTQNSKEGLTEIIK